MTKTILLIEDNEDIAELLTLVLEQRGFSVRHTASGVEGALLAARERWDTILLDVQLDELSGMAVQRVIRDLGDTPVIMMSAGSGDWDQRALQAGATATVTKPFKNDDLVALIQAITAARDTSSTTPPSDVSQLGERDLQRLRAMSEAELDALPFGLIRVNAQQAITGFNSFEQRASGHEAGRVLGKRFSDLAPCTRVKEFTDSLSQGFRTKQLDKVFRFVFPRYHASVVVSVRLYYDTDTDEAWIFVSPHQHDRAART